MASYPTGPQLVDGVWGTYEKPGRIGQFTPYDDPHGNGTSRDYTTTWMGLPAAEQYGGGQIDTTNADGAAYTTGRGDTGLLDQLTQQTGGNYSYSSFFGSDGKTYYSNFDSYSPQAQAAAAAWQKAHPDLVQQGQQAAKPSLVWDPVSGTFKDSGSVSGGSGSGSADGTYGGLTGANRDAAAYLTNLFTSYGLGSLAPKIIDYIKQGYGSDTVNILLQDTPEYKQRFAANDARRAKGLPVLSPAEYLATESQYRQILQSYGLPSGFYDQPSDFTNWLSSDVSPSEIAQRAKLASDAVQNTDPNLRQAFKDYYGVDEGHLAAHFLDSSRAEPLLQKQASAAAFGAAANRNGLSSDKANAELYAGMGITGDQANQGFGQISEYLPTASKLATLDGSSFGLSDAEAATFGQDGQRKKKLDSLASSERTRFSGAAGAGVTSLGVSSAGQL